MNNNMKNSSMPGNEDIIKQNPKIMQKFNNQTNKTIDKKAKAAIN